MRLGLAKRALAKTRGSTLIEFSLSALMLILVIFGVFELSRMLLVYTTVADAARAGARYAIVHGQDSPATASQIQTIVTDYLSAAPMATGNATVNVTGAGGAIGSTVTVNVTYPYDPFVGYYSPVLSINISSTSRGVITW